MPQTSRPTSPRAKREARSVCWFDRVAVRDNRRGYRPPIRMPIGRARLTSLLALCVLPFAGAASSLSPWERGGVRAYSGANRESSSSLRLSLSEKQKGNVVFSSLSPHPNPLPEGEGKSTIRSRSWISDGACSGELTVRRPRMLI